MNTLSLLAAAAMGALGGVHCVAMCGGVVGMLSSGLPASVRTSPLRQLPYALAYNAGRLISYAGAGFVAGGAGAMAGGVLPVHAGQFALRAFAGVMMVGVGLYLAGVLRAFGRLERLGAPLWQLVEPLARRVLPVRSATQAVALGMLWGWLPCGLVYAALALALGAGSASGGALTMLAFGVGTLPTLLALGAVASGLASLARRTVVRQTAGLLIVIFGAFNLLMVLGPPAWLSLPGHGAHAHCAPR
jgi:sulfite exporter TauE/SafE